jgi:hypothetical protein
MPFACNKPSASWWRRCGWLAAAPLLAATIACVPDVNVTGIRGDGGAAGHGAGGMGAGGAGGSGSAITTSVIRPAAKVHPGGDACIEATCPVGTEVVSGGGQWDALNITLNASRASDDRTWQICGSAAPGAMASWSVEAVCASLDVTVAETEIALHADFYECLTESCPMGMKVLGGGGRFATRLSDSRAAAQDDGWTLCGYSEAAGVDEWQVQASCAAVDSTSHYRAENHPGNDSCISQICPMGKKAVGGGAHFADGAYIRLDANHPSMDNGWEVCGHADDPDTHEWIIQVLCL